MQVTGHAEEFTPLAEPVLESKDSVIVHRWGNFDRQVVRDNTHASLGFAREGCLVEKRFESQRCEQAYFAAIEGFFSPVCGHGLFGSAQITRLEGGFQDFPCLVADKDR